MRRALPPGMLSLPNSRVLVSSFALVALAFAAGCAEASSDSAQRTDDAIASDALGDDMRLLGRVLDGGLRVQSYGLAAACGEVVTLEKIDRSLLPIGQYRIDQAAPGADGACTRAGRIAEGGFSISDGVLTLEDAKGAPLRTFSIDAGGSDVKLVAETVTLERRAVLAE